MRQYRTWQQAFDEMNASVLKHEIICAIASEVAGKPVENLIGFNERATRISME